MASPTFMKALNKMGKKRKKGKYDPNALPTCEPLQWTRNSPTQEHVTKYRAAWNISTEFCLWCNSELLPHANPNGPDFSQDCGCAQRALYNQSRRDITALLELAELNANAREHCSLRDSVREQQDFASNELHKYQERTNMRHARLVTITNEHVVKSRSK